MPTHATVAAWEWLFQFYANNLHVVADLFNEPRYNNNDWGIWHHAFQAIVTHFRKEGITNTMWLEGVDWASTLHCVIPIHDPNGTHGLLVYTLHHPDGPHEYQEVIGPQGWGPAEGDLAAWGYPVADTEFSDYVGGFRWHKESQVVHYLRYANLHDIAMGFWSISAGELTTVTGQPSRWPVGIGTLVRSDFRQQAQTNTTTGTATWQQEVKPATAVSIKRA
jgi:hypothetical protein